MSDKKATPLLKHALGSAAIAQIADAFRGAHPGFKSARFKRVAAQGLDEMELMSRARHIAAALDAELPQGDAAADIFVDALGPALAEEGIGGMIYFVHSAWLTHRSAQLSFDVAMVAAQELTRRFTAEFAIRPLIARDPERALCYLDMWARDDDHHLRRLVSEGTRPLLPWAPRLDTFLPRDDAPDAYTPIAALLDALKDDASLYVRRSVANHIGDLAKAAADEAYRLCAQWVGDEREEVQWVVRHGLRHPIKQGEPRALAVLGYAHDVDVAITTRFAPKDPLHGEKLRVHVELTAAKPARALVDLVVHYPRPSGKSAPKVFKLNSVELSRGETMTLSKVVSVADHSTRKVAPGKTRVEVQVNGVAHPGGAFTIRPR